MTYAGAAPDAGLDRNLRRLDCLARLSASRRAGRQRRQRTAAELELLVRRMEQAARDTSE